MRSIRISCLLLFLSFFIFSACETPEEPSESLTAESMVGTWYLIDRGPNLTDDGITECEKREFLVFRNDFTAMRHQDCLPKSDTEGVWSIVDGKCSLLMEINFNGMQVSNDSVPIEFVYVTETKIKVQKQYPLFVAWGIYEKTQ